MINILFICVEYHENPIFASLGRNNYSVSIATPLNPLCTIEKDKEQYACCIGSVEIYCRSILLNNGTSITNYMIPSKDFNATVSAMLNTNITEIPKFSIVEILSDEMADIACSISKYDFLRSNIILNITKKLIPSMISALDNCHALNAPRELVENILSDMDHPLENILQKLQNKNLLFCTENNINRHLGMYARIISNAPNHPAATIESKEVLHVSLEYEQAILGGLGVMATQMLSALAITKALGAHNYTPSIITPYYKNIYQKSMATTLIATIKHLYAGEDSYSNIYCRDVNGVCHYMVAPQGKHQTLFDLDSVNRIYSQSSSSSAIERVKYFNSAVAAFISFKKQRPAMTILHDWTTALVAKLLIELHNIRNIKSMFILHVSNIDYGGYNSESLLGIGLNFQSPWVTLKSIGIKYCDKIVTVSKQFLHECMTSTNADPNVEYLRRMFVTYSTSSNKIICILNGLDYNFFAPSRNLIDYSNINACKYRIKCNLSKQFTPWYSAQKINPNLPLIFYIGRFSPEKGVDTFDELIRIIEGKATFVALGRGMVEQLSKTKKKYQYRNDIYISNDQGDQEKYLNIIRACADFSFVPSKRESCCLVQLEIFTINGAPCITTRAGGLTDTVFPMEYSDLNNTIGNGFIFRDSLEETIEETLNFWSRLTIQQKNNVNLRIMQESKAYDWQAPNGSLFKYLNVFHELTAASSNQQHSGPEVLQTHKPRLKV